MLLWVLCNCRCGSVFFRSLEGGDEHFPVVEVAFHVLVVDSQDCLLVVLLPPGIPEGCILPIHLAAEISLDESANEKADRHREFTDRRHDDQHKGVIGFVMNRHRCT